jgi:cell pole-organizing protein PopZ
VSSSAPADDDIFSDKTRKAIDETFSKIEAPKMGERPAAAPHSFSTSTGASVEAIFERAVSEAFDPVLHHWMDANKAELLTAVKPLIREWMDEHFPALLEGAVRNEVERVVKARGR